MNGRTTDASENVTSAQYNPQMLSRYLPFTLNANTPGLTGCVKLRLKLLMSLNEGSEFTVKALIAKLDTLRDCSKQGGAFLCLLGLKHWNEMKELAGKINKNTGNQAMINLNDVTIFNQLIVKT